MDMTTQAAGIAIELGAALGLIGLILVPVRALRQAKREEPLVERYWAQVRAERRQSEVAAAPQIAPAPVGAGATIGSQRRESTPAVR
jgi:hypothetical protein